MSAGRDELLSDIAKADSAGHYEHKELEFVYGPLADCLHSLGYRKPREVTTAAELDALPVGSVVLDKAKPPNAWQKGADGIWWCGMFYRQGKDVPRLAAQGGGFTLLHEPEGER